MPVATAALTCNRLSLLEALTAVSSVVPTRSPRAILQSVCLRLDPDGSEIIGTDLELGIRHRVLGVHVDAPTRLVLPPGRLRSILSTSDDDEISLSTGDDKVTIRTRRAEFNLPTEDATLFPDLPTFDATDYHEVSPVDLRKAIRRTVGTTDQESTRYALSGCLLEALGDTMTLVGTDGRRLARQVVACAAVNAPTLPASPVIPKRALLLVDKVLDEDGAPIHIAVTDKAILFRTESATIHSRLVEGRYPNYSQIFPSNSPIKVFFPDIADLRLAVEQAGITCSEESRGIDWRLSSGVLKLSSTSPDVGRSDVEVPIAYEGDPLEITFDGRYAGEALKAIGDNVATTLELSDGKNVAVFRTVDSYYHALMPLTKER